MGPKQAFTSACLLLALVSQTLGAYVSPDEFGFGGALSGADREAPDERGGALSGADREAPDEGGAPSTSSEQEELADGENTINRGDLVHDKKAVVVCLKGGSEGADWFVWDRRYTAPVSQGAKDIVTAFSNREGVNKFYPIVSEDKGAKGWKMVRDYSHHQCGLAEVNDISTLDLWEQPGISVDESVFYWTFGFNDADAIILDPFGVFMEVCAHNGSDEAFYDTPYYIAYKANLTDSLATRLNVSEREPNDRAAGGWYANEHTLENGVCVEMTQDVKPEPRDLIYVPSVSQHRRYDDDEWAGYVRPKTCFPKTNGWEERGGGTAGEVYRCLRDNGPPYTPEEDTYACYSDPSACAVLIESWQKQTLDPCKECERLAEEAKEKSRRRKRSVSSQLHICRH